MGAQGRRLKILISAYACDPRAGSEQGFAWWWVHRCAMAHDVTVITCAAQRRAIEAARRDAPDKLPHVPSGTSVYRVSARSAQSQAVVVPACAGNITL